MLPDYYLLPRKLDLWARLRQKTLGHVRLTPEKVEKAKMLITLINWYSLVGFYSNEHEAPYIQLSTKHLKEVLNTPRPKQIVEMLVDLGVIESDKYYIRGSKALGYRLRKEYASGTLVREPMSGRSKKLVDRLNRRGNTPLALSRVQQEIHSSLSRCQYPESVNTYIGSYRGRKRSFREFCRDWINDHDSFFNVDENTGRVFHALTSTPKEMRSHVLFCGERAIEIDIPSAQPLLAATLYDKANCLHLEERDRYLRFIEDDFYVSLAKAANSRLRSRQTIKTACYRQIFFNQRLSQGKLWATFQKLFPILADRIRRVRETHGVALATYLQRQEADLVVSRVGERLMRKRIKFVTVHDAILCRESDVGVVRKELDRELRMVFGRRLSLAL